MNSFMTTVVIGVVAIFAATSAQQGTCGCAPQPTVIQLSCGGSQPNQGPSHPPPPPFPEFSPAPAPAADPAPFDAADPAPFDADAPADPAAAPPAWNIPSAGADTMPEELMDMCQFDSNGYPISHPPGGFPEGFHIAINSQGVPHAVASPAYPLPPTDWDGRMETLEALGFPMPQPGTPHYNMLMCSPIPVVTAGK